MVRVVSVAWLLVARFGCGLIHNAMFWCTSSQLRRSSVLYFVQARHARERLAVLVRGLPLSNVARGARTLSEHAWPLRTLPGNKTPHN